MGFTDGVQQLVFAGDCVELVLQQLELAEVFAEASESLHLVVQPLDAEFL